MSSAICFSLDQSEILSSGNGLTLNFKVALNDGMNHVYAVHNLPSDLVSMVSFSLLTKPIILI